MKTDKGIEHIIAKDGVYISTTSGVSMMPMLRDRRDTIVVSAVSERLKKYDVALYRRGEEYVLHRVVKVLPDSYVICGDNCVNLEYGIKDEDVIGKLSIFYRGKKLISTDKNKFYRIYSVMICATHPVRVLFSRTKSEVFRACKKLFDKKKKVK